MKLVWLLLDMGGFLRGSTRIILAVMGDTPFYFLPILVSITAAEHFETDRFYAMGTACMLLMPDFIDVFEKMDKVTFFSIPVISANYAYNVLPIILSVWILSKVEPVLKGYFPKALQGTLYPFAVFGIMAVCSFTAVGPLGSLAADGISKGLLYLSQHVGFVAWAMLAGMIPVFIPMGMHWIFVSTAITQIASSGSDTGIMAAFFISNMALAGVDFAVALKSADTGSRGAAFSAGIVALVSGVSEPSLFGVCLKEKAALRSAMLTGVLVGIYEGIVGIQCYVYSFPAVASILMFHGGEGAANLQKAVFAGTLSLAVSFLLTCFSVKRHKA